MIRHRLRDRCTIERLTATGTDGAGKPSGTWAALSSDVPCLFYSTTEGREVVKEKEAGVGDFGLVLMPGVDITDRDRVTGITTPNGTEYYSNEVFEIRSVRAVRTQLGQPHHTIAYLVMVR